MTNTILSLIIAYLLGSIPFGYLITKFSTSKNIFEVGWKKNSGSNVYKNIGKWQGVATFLFDAFKGYLAVYIAWRLGLPALVQVLCGLLAVVGHNWSIFLGFRGGRGLAALVGAVLFMNPLFLAIILIPCILFTIIWTASVGTLLSFLTGVIFSLSISGYEMVGLLLFLSLIPVLIKRLSPIKEILNSPNKEVIENRLFFDQDTVPPLRIKVKKPL